MNIPVSEFFKNHLHTQITVPMRWQIFDEKNVQDYSAHNLTALNLWLSKSDTALHQSEQHEKPSSEMIRIEQKLDLIINLFQQILAKRSANTLNLCAVLISIKGLSWSSPDIKLKPGQKVLIELTLDSVQMPLCLYAQIMSFDDVSGTSVCTARFDETSEQVREIMEKWIFNQHRHEIASLRQK